MIYYYLEQKESSRCLYRMFSWGYTGIFSKSPIRKTKMKKEMKNICIKEKYSKQNQEKNKKILMLLTRAWEFVTPLGRDCCLGLPSIPSNSKLKEVHGVLTLYTSFNWLLLNNYSLYDFKLAVTSMRSCGRCACALVHLFCELAYTLCRIRFTLVFW